MLHLNKIINNVKYRNYDIKFPQLSMEDLKLQLLTDASFNNLPNGRSQAGKILFLINNKKNTCPLYWNSSKIKRVVCSTIATETLPLSDACDLPIYINKLLSEISEHEKTTQTCGIQNFYDAAHSMKWTLEKRFLVDDNLHLNYLNTRYNIQTVITKMFLSIKHVMELIMYNRYNELINL